MTFHQVSPFKCICNLFKVDLIVSLVFSHLGFWSGNHFLIAPFPDLCLLVPSCNKIGQSHPKVMIYPNFVELYPLMLHAKLQNDRPSGSEKDNLQKISLEG